MIEQKHRGQLRQALQEVALSIGGVVATHPVDDDVVRALAGSIGAIADRHLSDRSGRSGVMDRIEPNPHPAVERLLARIGSPSAPAAAEPGTKSGDHQDDEEWLRLPGLFRRWEFEQVIDAGDEYLVQQAGEAEDRTKLFTIYSRPHAGREEAP